MWALWLWKEMEIAELKDCKRTLNDNLKCVKLWLKRISYVLWRKNYTINVLMKLFDKLLLESLCEDSYWWELNLILNKHNSLMKYFTNQQSISQCGNNFKLNMERQPSKTESKALRNVKQNYLIKSLTLSKTKSE